MTNPLFLSANTKLRDKSVLSSSEIKIHHNLHVVTLVQRRMMNTFYASSEYFGDNTVQVQTDYETVTIGDKTFTATVVQEYPTVIELRNGNEQYRCIVSLDAKGQPIVSFGGYTYPVQVATPKEYNYQTVLKSVAEVAIRPARIVAPMPGLIKSIAIHIGDSVKKGTTLLTLEAMKMENAIKSPLAGTVKSINVSAGQAVEKGFLLCEIVP